jgi:hypothetical protein
MIKRRITYFITLALLITSLLPIIGNNIPILASYRWLWAPTFILYVFLFETKIFLRKQVLLVVLYGIIYVWPVQNIIWPFTDEWYKTAIFEDFYGLLIPVLLFSIYSSKGYLNEWKRLSIYSIIFILVTGVMTIVATFKDPLIVRASYSDGKYEMSNFDYFYRLGFGSYGYMAAILSIFPTAIFFLKKGKNIWVSNWLLFSIIIFLFIVIIRAQIFANLIVATFIVFFSFLGASKFKKSFVYILIIIIISFLIPKAFYIENLRKISEIFTPGSELFIKFNDMANYLENPVIDEDDYSTETSGRASRYPSLLKTFLASPIFGDASYDSSFKEEISTGAHLYWMSRLALWGSLGFIGYILILFNVFKPVINMFNKDVKFYYYLSIGSIIALGFLKNLTGREIYILLLFVIPGLLLVKTE